MANDPPDKKQPPSPPTTTKAEARRYPVPYADAGPLLQRVAEGAYLTYAQSSGGLTHDGKQMPTFDKLGEPVRSHWCAVAKGLLQVASKMHPSELDLVTR